MQIPLFPVNLATHPLEGIAKDVGWRVAILYNPGKSSRCQAMINTEVVTTLSDFNMSISSVYYHEIFMKSVEKKKTP